jgi:Domain of unknown function (DUF4157)
MSDFIYENVKSSKSQQNDSLTNTNAPSFHISDKRSEAAIQRKFQQLSEQSSQHSQVTQLASEDEELPVQGKFSTIQKIGETEEEEPLQGIFSTIQKVGGPGDEEEPIQGKFQSGDVSQLVESNAQTVPNSTGLPDNLKSGIENISGYSMDSVNVHYNSDKPAQLQALAYTQGTDIHVAPGQEQHLPHEAWHVVQQMQGRVEPTLEMNGNIPVNDDKGLENEADTMGNRANSL